MRLSLTSNEQMLLKELLALDRKIWESLFWLWMAPLLVWGLGSVLLVVESLVQQLPTIPLWAIFGAAGVAGLVTLPVVLRLRKQWKRQITELVMSPAGLSLQRKARIANAIVERVDEAYDAYSFFAGTSVLQTTVGQLPAPLS